MVLALPTVRDPLPRLRIGATMPQPFHNGEEEFFFGDEKEMNDAADAVISEYSAELAFVQAPEGGR